MKRAEELMIPLDHYPHVPYWTTLREVIAILERSVLEIAGRKSVPRVSLVFDEKYNLLGTAGRRDLFRGLEPKFLQAESIQHRKKLFDVTVDPNLSELSHDRVLKGLKERAERPVSEIMRPVKATVNHNDHIMKVVYEMADTNISLLPVLRDEKVVGVVRSVELLGELAKLVL
jgi:CBS-domain-containing membrane protein